ncbi:pregnancy-specific glycoprotein 22-like isoform X2 [Tiliqua scincoides]|uniref:pregnancy-specific glycoprotein 22-like isoform X2 n=1 Tax=Tiliqua scincoides TaxID=71010 RepID=UPI0034636776
MMALPSSGRGALKAIMLSGIFLTSILQLAQAQNQLVVTKEPEYPYWGQEVFLIPSPISSNMTMCQWFRGSTPGFLFSNLIFSYSLEGKAHYTVLGNARTGRESIHQNCTLQIWKLTPQDTGTYTFQITQQSGEKVKDGKKTFQASTYLHIQTPVRIAVTADPPFPKLGQNVTLTPQGNFTQYLSCQWTFLPVDRPRHSQRIVRQILDHEVKQTGNALRVKVGDGCSLRITELTTTDTQNYSVTITARSQEPQQLQEPQEPGQRVHSQRELEQEYTGHISLNTEDPHAGSSASLSYSAGVIAGGLLGSLAWADSLMSLFSVLLGSFSSWRPKLFP